MFAEDNVGAGVLILIKSDEEFDNCLPDCAQDVLQVCVAILVSSFQSLSSGSSFFRKIEVMGVETEDQMTLSSHSSSVKRRKSSSGDEVYSPALKKNRN